MPFLSTDLRWQTENGLPIPTGTLHALFPPGVEDGTTLYRHVELLNAHPTSPWSNGKAWTGQDTAGGGFAIALAQSGAAGVGQGWPDVADSGLTYTSATTKSSGLTLPTLPPGERALIVVRRTLSGATPASPEVNRLIAEGDAPI